MLRPSGRRLFSCSLPRPNPETPHSSQLDLGRPFTGCDLRSLDRWSTYPTGLVALELLYQPTPRCFHRSRLPPLCPPAEARNRGLHLVGGLLADTRSCRPRDPSAVGRLPPLGAAVGRNRLSVGGRSHHRVAGSLRRPRSNLCCYRNPAGRQSNAPSSCLHPANHRICVLFRLVYNWNYLRPHLLPSGVRPFLPSSIYTDCRLVDGSKESKGQPQSSQEYTPFHGLLRVLSLFLQAEHLSLRWAMLKLLCSLDPSSAL